MEYKILMAALGFTALVIYIKKNWRISDAPLTRDEFPCSKCKIPWHTMVCHICYLYDKHKRKTHYDEKGIYRALPETTKGAEQ
jgi:hypothetical protein